MEKQSGVVYSLSDYSDKDIPDLVSALNNSKIGQWMSSISYPYTEVDALEWLKRYRDEQDKKPYTQINLSIRMSGKVIGGIGLMNIEDHHQAEIGYWLAEEYWGRGIMTSAVKRMIDVGFYFSSIQIVRIYATVWQPNNASRIVLEKNNFVMEGLMRKAKMKDGKFYNCFLYSIIRADQV